MRVLNLFLVFLFAISLLCSTYVYAERKDPMAALIDSDSVIKTYVADIKNSSGNNKIDLKDLKDALENVLASRPPRKFEFSGKGDRTKFKIVENPSEADIAVNTLITEYLWTEDDPVDMIVGVPSIAYDALTKENYARMQVVMTVNDTKSGMLLWEDSLKATITDKTMAEKESYDRINERIAKVFIRELFKRSEMGR